jgi:Na+/H+ antiporter NhaC
MAVGRKFLTHSLLLFLTVYTIRTDSTDVRNSKTEKRKDKAHSSKSKLKIDKGNPWPFLPSAGSHYTATKGYPSYPFMIVSPPGMKRID